MDRIGRALEDCGYNRDAWGRSMKSTIPGALIVMACCLAQPSQAQQKPPPRRPSMPLAGVVTNPDWLVKPNGDDMGRAYPPIASVLGLNGQITVKCKVSEAGGLEDCTVLSERPVGIGFGQAAIQLSSLFRMKPQTIDGSPIGGAEITIPINFVMANDTPPAAPVVERAPPSAKALALARRLIIALGVSQSLDQSVALQIQLLRQTEYASSSGADASAQDPAIQAFTEAFQAKRDVILDHYSVAYAGQFTEDELTQLVAHFENPAQKLWLTRQASLGPINAEVYRGVFDGISADARQRFCQKVACVSAAASTAAQGAKP